MMHGKAIWKPEICEMAKASRDIAPGPHKGGLQQPIWTPAARVNVLMHVGLWPRVIKQNPSRKLEVIKRAWIKPWYTYTYVYICIKVILVYIAYYTDIYISIYIIYMYIYFIIASTFLLLVPSSWNSMLNWVLKLHFLFFMGD